MATTCANQNIKMSNFSANHEAKQDMNMIYISSVDNKAAQDRKNDIFQVQFIRQHNNTRDKY